MATKKVIQDFGRQYTLAAVQAFDYTDSLDGTLEAPLAVGDAVGSVQLTLDGETVFRAPVVALEAVEQGGFFARLWDMILMWIAKLFST